MARVVALAGVQPSEAWALSLGEAILILNQVTRHQDDKVILATDLVRWLGALFYNTQVTKKKDLKTPSELMPLPWDKGRKPAKGDTVKPRPKLSQEELATVYENMDLTQKRHGQ